MNIKKIALFVGFFAFFAQISVAMVGNDINFIPAVKEIKKLDLKVFDHNMEEKSKLIVSKIKEEKSFSGENFSLFINRYDRLANETLNPISQKCNSFRSLIQQSDSIEDLYYCFFLDNDGVSVNHFMTELNVKKDIEDSVKNFLNNDFIKTVPYHSDLKEFLNVEIIQNFIEPVKEKSTSFFGTLNNILKTGFPKNRAKILKNSLLQEINKQQKEIIRARKGLNDKIGKDFLHDLSKMLNSFFLYIKWGLGSLEEIQSRINIRDKEEYRLDEPVLEALKKEEEKYRKIRRNFLVLTSPQLYDFKPFPIANYFRYLAQLSLFSSIVYLFRIGTLNQLFWRKFVGFPQDLIRAMFTPAKTP